MLVTANKTIGTPRPEWVSMEDQWARSRAILGGLETALDYDSTVRRRGRNLLVPFSYSMSEAQYAFLKLEAELPCVTASFAKILVESLLRKRPTLELSDSEHQNWILDEFGQDGLPIEATLSDVLQEELATGRAWVFVEHPAVDAAQLDALSEEERRAIRPYPVIRQAEEVINWNYTSDARGRRQLTFVLIRSWESTYAIGNVHPTVRQVLWHHYLNAEGNYAVGRWVGAAMDTLPTSAGRVEPASETSGFEFAGEVPVLVKGEPLRYIPAWPLSGKTELSLPPLMPLIQKEIGLYNKMTRRNHLLYNASTFTPVIISDLSDTEFDKVVGGGLGTWIKLPSDSKIDSLKTPTEALRDYETAISNGLLEMARLGVRMLSPETAQSGVALEIRNASQTAQLGALNGSVSSTWRQVIRCMVHWYTGKEPALEDVKFSLSADYLSSDRDANALRLVTEWYENGHIPRDVWVTMLRENNFLPDGYDDAEGLSRIRVKTAIPPLDE
ncbi:hypothetical protein [EBPR siphovirus 1]|nr:hypothetical protein [EBPR siphovirus 1]